MPAAGRAVGTRRFVAQSFAGWTSARGGAAVKSEDDPLDPDPPAALRSTLAAIRHVEEAVTGIDWADGGRADDRGEAAAPLPALARRPRS